MAIMEVRNGYAGWLLLWLEPLGEDRWLRPDEAFHIRSDYQGDKLAFTVVTWADEAYRADGIEQMAVWVEHGDFYAEVTDQAGNVIECGHNRPAEIHRRWTSARE
ncbi:hypothetical protein AB0M46_07595 [Dactylosporangium sp. NPDC051485]|uniref:hypothetical protein n=1 Tax=Dactylosporangium sp. NPDC051485 TaxID=3154846 RepID=UPI0034151F26